MRKELVLNQMDDGCIIPLSHALNADGYFRKMIDGQYVFFHRWVYENQFGSIPDGFEVDHICRNRACCNIMHLQLLERSEHKSKTNRERYAHIKEEARAIYTLNPRITGKELAAPFGRSISTGCKWIREFRRNDG